MFTQFPQRLQSRTLRVFFATKDTKAETPSSTQSNTKTLKERIALYIGHRDDLTTAFDKITKQCTVLNSLNIGHRKDRTTIVDENLETAHELYCEKYWAC